MQSSFSPDVDHSTDNNNAESARLRLQINLLEQRAQLAEQLTDQSIDCVATADLNLNITAWNKSCFEYSGIDSRHAIGSSFRDLFSGSKKPDNVYNALPQLKAGFKVFLPASQNVWLKGYYEVHLIPLKNEASEVTGILIIAHDVAHRVKAENELKSLNKTLREKYAELERTNAELSDYTRITSEDVKDPLRKIYSFIEKVVSKDGTVLSNDSRGMLRRAQSALQRVSLLADSLVTLSSLRPEARTLTSLNMVVQEAISMVQPQTTFLQGQIKSEDLPFVPVSPRQLRLLFQQLLIYMLRSAALARPPMLHITATRKNSDELKISAKLLYREYVVVLIENKAPTGLAPSETISGKEMHSGAGFGLAIARKIAENHFGALQFSNGENGQDSIECYLPAEGSALL